jgi:Ca2+-binding EF-hand superfamily protein
LRMALDFDFEDVPFSNDFALALRDIREEYQKQLAALKGTDDAWFKEKVTTCLGGLERQNKEMKLLKEEIASLKAERSTFYALKTEFKAKEAAWLEEKATWEGQMTAMRNGYELSLQEKDVELAGLREKLMTALHDLKNLVDVKLSMDEEIGVYQKLLQVRASSSTTVVGGGTTIVGGGSSSSTTTTTIVGGGGGGGMLVGGGGGSSTTTTTVVGGGGGSGVVIGGVTASSTTTTVTSGWGSSVSAAESDYYLGIFNSFDRSGDGQIDASELLQLFDAFDARPFLGRVRRNATPRYCQSLLASADSDGSGKLSFNEFLRLMIYEKKVFLNNAFAAADAANKGWLTEAEVLNALQAAGFEVTGTAHDIVNKSARHDGADDGKIFYTEFINNL